MSKKISNIYTWLADLGVEGASLSPDTELYRLPCEECNRYKCKRIVIQPRANRLLWDCQRIDAKFKTINELEDLCRKK